MKRKAAIALLALAILLAGVVLGLGYRGPRSFPSGAASLPPPEAVVANARLLAGTPYDPFMGGFGNIGASLGCIVCSDVPNIAYGRAGYSLQSMLAEDYKLHPKAYGTSRGNDPRNPYFPRRARNLYAYFLANGRALPPEAKPAVGDLVFYRNHPGAEVSHVTLVTSVDGSGNYRVMEADPMTILAQELDGTAPLKRGLLLAGFGRMYMHPR